jgi:hypothetical protein
MNRLLNSCSMNLSKQALVEAGDEKTVQRVILTPEGDEIALPREALEAGESAPVHGKECPCRRCAEKYRGVPPEEHHEDCACGLCEEASGRRSVGNAGGNAGGNGREARRISDARRLYRDELTPMSESKPASIYDFLYSEEMKQHEAEQAARARAAREAGLEPPAYEPFKIESEATKRMKAEMERIEANRRAARETWKERFPDDPLDEISTLSWNEQEDLRVAQMRAAG